MFAILLEQHALLLLSVQMAFQSQRKTIYELILHFAADTVTDKSYFGISFVADAERAVLRS